MGKAVNASENLNKFEKFLKGYRDFLSGVVEEQNQKLTILLTHDIEAIGRNATRQQAITLEIKGYEENRIQLQKEAGFGNKTLGEIVESLHGPQRQRFRQYHQELQQAVEQIKFLNSKAMQIVETNLQVISMITPETQSYNEEGRQISGTATGSSVVLDSKI